MNFATLKGLTIPEGVVTQIADVNGNVLWMLETSKPIVLEVEKITSDTYANSTTYSNEQFVLINIYPKTANSTVSVTYGELTKTLTFTSTSAQKVYFGTFNGVPDGVTTPASGTLTINGECAGVSIASYNVGKSSTDYCQCIIAVSDLGNVTFIPDYAFYSCTRITNITIPESVTSIGALAFGRCRQIKSFTIPSAVTYIGKDAFYDPDGGAKTYILKPTTPPTLYGAGVWYGPTYIQAIIVPKGCGNTYKAAEYWSKFADKIVEES